MGIISHQIETNRIAKYEWCNTKSVRQSWMCCIVMHIKFLCSAQMQTYEREKNRLTMHIFNTMPFRTFFLSVDCCCKQKLIKLGKRKKGRNGKRNCCKIYAFHFAYRLYAANGATPRLNSIMCHASHWHSLCFGADAKTYATHTHSKIRCTQFMWIYVLHHAAYSSYSDDGNGNHNKKIELCIAIGPSTKSDCLWHG